MIDYKSSQGLIMCDYFDLKIIGNEKKNGYLKKLRLVMFLKT